MSNNFFKNFLLFTKFVTNVCKTHSRNVPCGDRKLAFRFWKIAVNQRFPRANKDEAEVRKSDCKTPFTSCS
jgi:hypothetical protein